MFPSSHTVTELITTIAIAIATTTDGQGRDETGWDRWNDRGEALVIRSGLERQSQAQVRFFLFFSLLTFVI